MTITQLQYVLAVAEYKNFTKAAEKVFVTQPTLSMQVQKLEEELDVKIFNRSKKPIELTSVGIQIINQAKNIVNESNRIADIVEQQKGYIGGEFRIGIISTVMPTLLPMFLKNFVNKYPKVQLKIEEMTTDVIIDRIKEGHLDAGIAASPLDNDALVEKPLYYEPFVAYVPPNHKFHQQDYIKVNQLDPEEILLLEDGHCFKDSILNLCKNVSYVENTKAFHLESGSFETLTRLSDEGLGMTLLPYLHTMDLPEKQKQNLRYFEKPNPAREISIIHHKNELKSHLIEALKQVISGVVKGAIKFQDVKIISPIQNSKLK
ncbi:LysR family transcriptional regulator, hydrogen peroxide-inducible genes activator [Psychroflexus salarius]|uniref:LysR family transcriptional regulator, hydrogen peroxide-inducible genes activator n=1 Tax=Psychroflexus salarius TaxID=1155689 RepID=A0A1M4SUJ5_9FLAO|nr:LysR substrate-binding domain-containing protein [Psychroflexus salarius]SHE35848.1 LysR family transcriptional regulator, hydrogen peroxide-inducible genes activator [Psychroflexus salarius]